MKKSFILILVLISSFKNGFTQNYGWKDISKNLPDYSYDTTIINNGQDTLLAIIYDICFISNNEGWITTWHAFNDENAAILHTTDGGETWEVQTVMRPCQVIQMVDENIGYAGSDGGLIFKTTDGGLNWNYYGLTGAPIAGMSFVPGSDTGYICSYMSSYLQQITPVGVNPISLGNSGWWNSISSPSHDLIWICAGTSVLTFDKDGLTDQPITSAWYNSIEFMRNDLGWGVGYEGLKGLNPGVIAGCNGKNIDWVHLKYTEQPLNEVFALDNDHVWAAGNNGYIYFSENASQFSRDTSNGSWWSNVTFVSQPNPRPDVDFLSLFFTSPQNGFASGGKNCLLKYTQINGIEENLMIDFEIFPNPAANQLKIINYGLQGKEGIIDILDVFGKVVWKLFEGILQSDNMEFDIKYLPTGVYFIRATSSKRTITKKFIKIDR